MPSLTNRQVPARELPSQHNNRLQISCTSRTYLLLQAGEGEGQSCCQQTWLATCALLISGSRPLQHCHQQVLQLLPALSRGQRAAALVHLQSKKCKCDEISCTVLSEFSGIGRPAGAKEQLYLLMTMTDVEQRSMGGSWLQCWCTQRRSDTAGMSPVSW